MRVVVVGSGFAGLGATQCALDAGAEVTLISAGIGASSFYAGALDDEPWDVLERAAATLRAPLVAPSIDPDMLKITRSLDLFSIPDEGAMLPRLATTAGVLRSARAHDRALLDLNRARGRAVLVPRADRAGWDADSMVRCLREAWSSTGEPSEGPSGAPSFEAVSTPVLRFDEERDIVDADLAARHDDPSRLAWLSDRLSEEIARRGAERVAILLGPWLGAARSRADELSDRLGVPVGESLAATAATAGLRFEAARTELLRTLDVRTIERRATSITAQAPGLERRRFVVDLEGAEGIPCDAVVITSGGLVGGGLRFEPAEHAAAAEGADHVRTALVVRPRFEGARLSLGLDIGPASSTHGPVLDDRGWPTGATDGALERAGVLVGDDGRAAPFLYAAGDLAFGRRRTVLSAVRSGAAAGWAATRAALAAVASVSTP